MKKIKNIIAIAILLFAFTTYGQTNSAPAANNPALKETALKANKKAQERQTAQAISNASSNYINPVDENDQYMGKENEFLNMITLSSLPSDFPKYQKGWTFTEYDNQTEKYFKEHISILKEVYKSKF
jgi:hypothetical protein